jgi:DNA primase
MTVEELLEKQKIPFRMSGRDIVISCLNPDHADRNPSMRIDRATGIYHCFSCSFKGNLFSRFNVIVSKLQVRRETLAKKLESIKLENVGLRLPESLEYFEKDYRGISSETYKQFKAFTHLGDFKDRIVFPIYDITGKITAFNARSFDDQIKPKYLIYPRQVSLPLFPLTAKPKGGSIILVEGIFDMLNMHDKGITNTMCTFGTSTVNEERLKLLSLLGCTKLYTFFDGDDAGQEGANKVAELAKSLGFQVDNIFFRGRDPGSLSRKQIDKVINIKCPEYF